MLRYDVPYAVPPGPPLSVLGEAEALRLRAFLRPAGIACIHASPFLRAHRTAEVLAGDSLPIVLETKLGEWRADERARDVAARLETVLAAVLGTHAQAGAICLVSHGGPIAVLLRKLGMDRAVVDAHCRTYGGATPMPPAGVWRATRTATCWQFELVFTP